MENSKINNFMQSLLGGLATIVGVLIVLLGSKLLGLLATISGVIVWYVSSNKLKWYYSIPLGLLVAFSIYATIKVMAGKPI